MAVKQQESEYESYATVDGQVPVKRGRGRPKGTPNRTSPVIGFNGVKTNPGDNSKYAELIMELSSWGRVDPDDFDELERRLNRYLQFCDERDIRITNQACYMALGITKDEVYDWESRRSRGSDPRYYDFIKKVKQICATNREFLMSDGKLNPITGIWWQKQYEGMTEKSELILTPNNPLGPEPDADKLAEDYLKALPAADDDPASDYPATI